MELPDNKQNWILAYAGKFQSIYDDLDDHTYDAHLSCASASLPWSAVYRPWQLIIQVCNIKPKVVSPISYISRIASNVDPPISVAIQKHAIKLLEKLNDSRAGKDPIAFAAAALYYVCQLKNLKHTQNVLGMAAGVTEVTIRNRINDIKKETLNDMK